MKNVLWISIHLTTLALKITAWLGALGLTIGMLIVTPYIFLGVVFSWAPGQTEARRWISNAFQALLLGNQSIVEVLGDWPLHQQAVWDGIAMSWMALGFLVVLAGGLGLLFLPFVVLFQCDCPTPKKETA